MFSLKFQGQNLLESEFEIPIFGINPVNKISTQIYNFVMKVCLFSQVTIHSYSHFLYIILMHSDNQNLIINLCIDCRIQ